MKSLLRLLLKSQQNRKHSDPNRNISGFTLIELLVAMIMTFLILTPLLTFVVDMVNTDRREQLKANTEQDVQTSVDFIAQDLSQALYIYDNDGINAIAPNFIPSDANNVPILVFWKRRLIKDSIPVTVNTPKLCDPTAANDCDDTYVLSLVAYYQVKDTVANPIWCQPASSAANCPTRIVRYEIKDGVKNPAPPIPDNPYYTDAETNPNQRKDAAFDKTFDLAKPTEKVTTGANNVTVITYANVLVNNIDQSTANVPAPIDCKTTLGVADPASPAAPITNADLLISDGTTNSFYACVDKSRTLARVYIRGNAMRRMYNDGIYKASNAAFFPTASAQVKGLSAPGK